MGMEDVFHKLNQVKAENLFIALLNAYNLHPIKTEESARNAERVIEYIERAFETNVPDDVKYYAHVLHILINEYDDKHYISAAHEMAPHEFLKALLEEEGISQKALVPDCFHTESQVSEFLHQRKGREKLSYEQAVALGKRFKVDPLNFLPRI